LEAVQKLIDDATKMSNKNLENEANGILEKLDGTHK